MGILRTVLAQLELPLHPRDFNLHADDGLHEPVAGLHRHVTLPAAGAGRFVKLDQVMEHRGEPLRVGDQPRHALRMDCGVVPGGHRRRGGIPGGRNIGVGTREDHQHLPPIRKMFPLGIRPRHVRDQGALRSTVRVQQHRHMRGMRHRAIVGHDGREAVLPHKSGQGLWIIDLEMPGIDGLQLARTIREDPDLQAVKVIALTTLNRRSASQEAKRLEATACLSKPVRSIALLDALLATVGAGREHGEQPRLAHAPVANVRLLVADDNLVNRRLALAQLAQIGIQADTVVNGLEALAAMERVSYALILMDGQMPEMDGYLATAEIRRREGKNRHTIIVAMTADALSGDRQRCLNAGMDDYLAKPVKSADLRAVLARWLPTSNAESAIAGNHKEEPFSDDSTSVRIRGEASERPTTARYRRLIRQSGELDATVIEDLLAQGGVALISSLGESLRQEALIQLPMLERAVTDRDGIIAAAAAHRLKGAAWSLGLRALASACLALEHALDLDMVDTTRLFHEVAKAYEHGQAVLDTIVKGTGT